MEQLLVCIGVVALIVSGLALVSALNALTTSYAAAQGPLAIVATTIAVLSLIVNAIIATANFRRQRRDATLAAYNAWSDTTMDTRIGLRKRLGEGVLSDELGMELAAGPTATSRRQLTKGECTDLSVAIVAVLNGLERLAVGVNLGTYDILVIRQLGGTLVIRYWDRFRPYVMAKRGLRDPQRRQTTIYLELERLAAMLGEIADPEDTHPIDKSRLAALKMTDQTAPGSAGKQPVGTD